MDNLMKFLRNDGLKIYMKLLAESSRKEQKRLEKRDAKKNYVGYSPLLYSVDYGFISNGSIKERKVKSMKDLFHQLGIAKVIFNDKATIVYLTTGEKGVAIKGDTEEFDPVIGLSVAYALAESGVSKKIFKGIVNKYYEKKVR